MFIKKHTVYVNFTGTQRVRVGGFEKDTKAVIAHNLNLPGGTTVISREEFQREFAEESQPDTVPFTVVENLFDHRRNKTAQKFKSQEHNPYAPKA